MVAKHAKYIDSDIEIETEMDHSGNVPKRIYYPKNLEELEVTARILKAREIEEPKDCSTVYPIISLKKNTGIVQSPMLLNLIPANLCDADDVLEHAFPESTMYPISGASNIHIDSWKCRIPRNLLRDNLKAITEHREYRSVLEVHSDIVKFLKNFYELPEGITMDNTFDIRTMGSRFLTPDQQGARLGAFCGAYIFLVTQFCLHNPLMKDSTFIRVDNAGMKRFLGHEYFFSDVFDSVPLVTEGYLNHQSYFVEIAANASRWVRGINKSLDMGTPFFASESLSSLFSEEYLSNNHGKLFETIYYKGKFHVICSTPDDFHRIKDVVRELKDEDHGFEFSESEINQILDMGLFFVDTPELKRLYRLELLRQGVGDHLSLKLGGVLK